jgi:hypothetical protein
MVGPVECAAIVAIHLVQMNHGKIDVWSAGRLKTAIRLQRAINRFWSYNSIYRRLKLKMRLSESNWFQKEWTNLHEGQRK